MDKLCAFMYDGKLHPDNNAAERSIRATVIGRKNYLLAGSHESAKRIAILYSLIGTCKLHNINPSLWLKDVLTVINDHPINRIKELLPHIWITKQSNALQNHYIRAIYHAASHHHQFMVVKESDKCNG